MANLRFLVMILLLVPLLATATQALPPPPTTLRVFLTFKSGAEVGGLNLNASTPSDALSSFPDPTGGTTANRLARIDTVRQRATGGAGTISPMVFRSGPLAESYHVNASRQILFTIVFTTCVVYDMELYADATFLGGTYHRQPHSYTNRDMPDGEGAIDSQGCRPAWDTNRHSTSIEGTIELPAGSVLELRIYQYDLNWAQVRTNGATNFGSVGYKVTRSYLEIPLLTTQEYVTRYGAPSLPAGPAGPDLLPALLAAATLLVVLVVSPRGSGLRRGLPLLALLAAPALAGCLGGDDDPTPAETTPGGGTSEGEVVQGLGERYEGALLGNVRDDLGFAVPAARVSLAELGSFTLTSKEGYFEMLSLPAGRHTVTVFKPGFKLHRTHVDLPPKDAFQLNVVLDPLQKVDPNFRPHQHDLWPPGADTRTLLDAPVDLGDGACTNRIGVEVATARCELPTDRDVRVPLAPPGALPIVVPPGTVEVEVRVGWPAANKVGQVGLLVHTNADPSVSPGDASYWQGKGDHRVLAPRPANVPFRIQTGWEMADDGHQGYSTWGLRLFVPTFVPLTDQSWTEPFHLTIVAHRGPEVRFEPAHRDFWRNGTDYTVIEYDRHESNSDAANHAVDFNDLGWSPGARLVPPLARWIEAELSQSWDSAEDFELNATAAEYDPRPIRMRVSERKELTTRYWLPVCPGQTDQYYQGQSRWSFTLFVDESQRDLQEAAQDNARSRAVDQVPLQDQGLGYGRLQFALRVIAHRTPPAQEANCA